MNRITKESNLLISDALFQILIQIKIIKTQIPHGNEYLKSKFNEMCDANADFCQIMMDNTKDI